MWDKSPTLFATEVEKVAVSHVKKVGQDMIGSLVDVSPVDSSRFVSNNNVSIGQPDWSYNENKLLGERGSEAEGLSKIASLNNLQDLWFTNATPYGGELEGGKSAQAPTGVYLPVFLAVHQWYRT